MSTASDVVNWSVLLPTIIGSLAFLIGVLTLAITFSRAKATEAAALAETRANTERNREWLESHDKLFPLMQEQIAENTSNQAVLKNELQNVIGRFERHGEREHGGSGC